MGNRKNLTNDRIFSIIATGAAVLAGTLVNSALEEGWRKVKKEEPPEDPTSEDVSWSDAITWTVATGVVIGLVNLAVKKGLSKGRKKLK